MATRFTEQVNIRQVNTSTGAAAGISSLADRLNSFSSQQAQAAQVNIQRKAQLSAVEGQTQFDPNAPLAEQQRDVPVFFGQEAKAFNQGLRASYIAGVDRDMTMQIGAAKAKHSNNLIAFNDEVEGILKGVLDTADPASRSIIAQSSSDTIHTARMDVQKSTIQKSITDADDDLIASQEFYTDEAGLHAFKGDELSSSEALIKGLAVNTARLESGQINQKQMINLNENMVQEARIQKNRGEVSRVLELPNGIEIASKAIQQLHETPLKGMTIEQNDELVSVLNSDLNTFISLQNKQESADQVSLTARQGRNYTNLLVNRATGQLNQDVLNKAAKRGDISGSQFSTLTSKLSSQGVGVTNQEIKFGIQQQIISGIDVTDMITNNWGSHLSSIDARELLVMQQEYGDKESVLNTSPAKRARTFVTESMKITGIFGSLTDDAAKKTAEAIREYDERVLEGEDPWIVADDMADRDSLTKLEGTWGRKHDVKNIGTAIDKLNADTVALSNNAKGNQVELDNIKNTYNRSLHALEQIRDLQLNQTNFEEASKRALQP